MSAVCNTPFVASLRFCLQLQHCLLSIAPFACTSSTVISYTQIIVVQTNAKIAVKTLSFGTANAQARSVWTRGMKIHFGSSKFSGKVASIKLQLRYSVRQGPTPRACLNRFLPCLKRIITYKRRKRRLQY